jgi:hypothetical protein
MRLKYFVMAISIATALGLVCTWQQVGIIQLAYQQDRKNKTYKELFDRNRYLRYNLINLTSASYLGNKLFDEDTSFEIPRESQIRILSKPRKEATYTSRAGGHGQSTDKNKIPVSAIAKIQDTWPITAIDRYFNKQAQAQDMKAKRRQRGRAQDFYQFYSH